jgi:hypothetical protein
MESKNDFNSQLKLKNKSPTELIKMKDIFMS